MCTRNKTKYCPKELTAMSTSSSHPSQKHNYHQLIKQKRSNCLERLKNIQKGEQRMIAIFNCLSTSECKACTDPCNIKIQQQILQRKPRKTNNVIIMPHKQNYNNTITPKYCISTKQNILLSRHCAYQSN